MGLLIGFPGFVADKCQGQGHDLQGAKGFPRRHDGDRRTAEIEVVEDARYAAEQVDRR